MFPETRPLFALRWLREELPEGLLAPPEAAVELLASFDGSLEHDWLLFGDWLELLLFSSLTVGSSEPPVPPVDLQGWSFKLVGRTFVGCTCNFDEADTTGLNFAAVSVPPGLSVETFDDETVGTGFFGLFSLEPPRLFPAFEISWKPAFPDQETD